MTTVLLKAWTNDEYIEPRVAFAVVEIPAKFARVILARMDAADSIYKDDGDFTCAEWWSYAPSWYEWDEEIDGILNLGEIVVLPGPPPISSEAVRQDITRMRIYPSLGGVYPSLGSEATVKWAGYIKHTSVVIDTARVKRSTLEKIANGTL